ncbi:MAG: carboxypeptidase [Bdellovibrionales bacterium]|nr:carboxypeptidase [Bdellovibrionales bacterium]
MKIKILLMSLIVFSFQFGRAESVGAFSPKKQYKDVVQYLQNLEKKYPQVAEVFILGDSDSGEQILGIRIGTSGIENLVVGTHHGNEYGSTEVALAFAGDLAANPIVGQIVYVVPVLNISGYNAGLRSEQNYAGRKFDPNRDYIGPCKEKSIYGDSFNLKSTTALAAFLKHTNIINSATLHTYHPGVLYPWGLSTNDLDTGYNDLFIELGQAATTYSKYTVGNSTDILYPAEGTYEDYAFWQHGIWSMLFELGYTHSPSDNQIRDMVAVNVPGIRKMFEIAPTVRAPRHHFSGACTRASILLDRHDE